MARPLYRSAVPFAFLLIFAATLPSRAQLSQLDQIQVAPPMRQVPPPSPDATAKELERQADQLRSQKAYIDAIDYFEAAIKKDPNNATLYNKIGISELMLQRFREAGKHFETAIKKDRKLAEAYNNLGVVNYERKKYRGAIKQYKKALEVDPDSASFHSNLGAAYFAQKKFEEATKEYAEAVRLDPEIFEHSSRMGITAQMSSPQDRAHYSYVLAKLYAKMGDSDRSLQYLRKALEEGYKKVDDAYKDPEFAELRKDARFTELMKERPAPLPE
ncbi:MAG TPA: tetratricopeptide repeat protein [Terriglobales bacterium]|jgi:tetratricopeptide (TPR) repeat protein|nr:tetratricopeptide repeat protein [Terriglobales bacterium]